MKYILPVLTLLLSSCSLGDKTIREESFVFGTRVEISIQGEPEERARPAITAVMQEFQRLHDMLHAWKPSELTTLNRAIAERKSTTVSAELAAILNGATQYSLQSQSLFNPAIGQMIQLWGFHADTFQPALADAKKLDAIVNAHPKMSDLIFSTSADNITTVTSRNKDVQLDLGGYAKGYALDRAANILKLHGIQNALVNIGGNIIALGNHGKRHWQVGIQHPRKPSAIATVELLDGEAIGTSGDYQRYFELNGKRYCHLINPATGQPVQGVQAVTVITRGLNAGTASDAVTKPIFIAGAIRWKQVAELMGQDDIMLIDGSGTVHLTPSMQGRVKFVDKDVRLKPVR